MDRCRIDEILLILDKTKDRNLVIIDYGNVQKWENGLGWKIGIKELKNLVKHFTCGKKFLRRFYYGSDYGKNDKLRVMTLWSAAIQNKAKMNDFEIITKAVKYIIDASYRIGYVKKCNFDVEMAVDMIKEQKNYDNVILFSGDGDMAYVLKYLYSVYNKNSFVFGARNHIGREIIDAKAEGVISEILYVEDFEYRLNMNRFRQ